MPLQYKHRLSGFGRIVVKRWARSKGSVASGRATWWGEAPERPSSVRGGTDRLQSLTPDTAARAEPPTPDAPSLSVTPERRSLQRAREER
jgi:hypothetical protein